jgi:signal transduction histidine kinase
VEKGVIDLRNWNFTVSGPVPLKGEWEVYPKEFIYKSTLSNNHSYYKVPMNWSGFTTHPGYASYHLKILLGENREKLFLKVNSISCAYKVFQNEKLIYSMGTVGSTREENIPKMTSAKIPLESSLENELDLIFHVSDFHHGEGGINREIILGNSEDIHLRFYQSLAKSYIFFGIIFMMGFHYFLLSLVSIDMKVTYRYFAYFCFSVAVRILFVEERNLLKIFPNIYSDIYIKGEFVLEFTLIGSFIKFIYSFFSIKSTKHFHLYYFIFAILCVALPDVYSSQVGIFLRPLILPIGLYTLFDLKSKMDEKSNNKPVYISLFILILVSVANDILFSLSLIDTTYLFNYAIILFIMYMSYTLSLQLSTAFKETQELSNQLKKVSEVKDNFMANLSHELRTPLSLIYAYSELLSEDENDPEISKEYGNDIFRETRVLIEIINDLMMVTDLETKLSLKADHYKLRSILDEAIFYLQKFKEEKQVQIYLNIDQDSIYCDKSLITKVCIIIIKNSIQYGDFRNSIHISSRKKENMVEILFEDDGMGVPESDLEKIYDKFYRIDNTITYKVSGVGVGLFIVKRIIELHNGSIFSYNRIGGGLATVIHLPL